MKDKYENFAQLNSSEPRGSYRIEVCQKESSVALIAPHAGKIEPGTSEICRYVAGDDLTYYLFEGLKSRNNQDLHITSSNFDEPQGLHIAQSAQVVVTFHGQAGSKHFVNVGGRAIDLCKNLIKLLVAEGYNARWQDHPALQGLASNNICNRGKRGEGIQLEISRGLRDLLVNDEASIAIFSATIKNALRQSGL
ncbi:MAG: poly-gamma-glutamate hydrolase family protein [Kangiella sp.]|nr:poly-gamma-glutamate hydrolase family protein [Kangiella sp.]